MAANNIPFVAGGNIAPCRIVVQSDDFTVIQSTASPGKPPTGISSEATRRPPNSAYDDGYAAIANGMIRVYQLGEHALCDVGSPISAGDWIKPDANGRGVPASTGNYYVGQAVEAGSASNKRVLVKVQPGTL